VTVAELRLGVLTASTLEAKARRMATLRLAESLEPLPVDDQVADAWAVLAGRRLRRHARTRRNSYERAPGLEVIRLESPICWGRG
jgi:predicted nucleic acid-binding protein